MRYVLEINRGKPVVTESGEHLNSLHELVDAYDAACKDLEREQMQVAEILFGVGTAKPISCSDMIAEIKRLQQLSSQAEACSNLALNAMDDYEKLFNEGKNQDDKDEEWTDIDLGRVNIEPLTDGERALQERGGWRRERAEPISAKEFNRQFRQAVQPDFTPRISAVESSCSTGLGLSL